MSHGELRGPSEGTGLDFISSASPAQKPTDIVLLLRRSNSGALIVAFPTVYSSLREPDQQTSIQDLLALLIWRKGFGRIALHAITTSQCVSFGTDRLF